MYTIYCVTISLSLSSLDQVAKEGKNIQLCTMGPGKYFGEVALVSDSVRTATVVTTTRSVIMMITKDKFTGFFQRFPEVWS